MRTKEVFSFTPVTSAARFRITSSMFSVVLMHIRMPHGSITRKEVLFPIWSQPFQKPDIVFGE